MVHCLDHYIAQAVGASDIIGDVHHHYVPMRWADLDPLDHVNNVVYVTYAEESRAAMVADGRLPRGLTPVATTVRFLRPMRLVRRPVIVASEMVGDDLVQHITVDDESERSVFAEVTTSMGDRSPALPHHGIPTEPTILRRDDLGGDGVVTPTKMFELFQEARVLYISSVMTATRPGRLVVGTSTVTFREDIRWRDEPCRGSVWISRIGNGSFDMRSELSDGRAVLAESTTTMVGFDSAVQTSRAFDDDERAMLTSLLHA